MLPWFTELLISKISWDIWFRESKVLGIFFLIVISNKMKLFRQKFFKVANLSVRFRILHLTFALDHSSSFDCGSGNSSRSSTETLIFKQLRTTAHNMLFEI